MRRARNIRVLQLLDKTAVRGASIHGVSRLVLGWWPEFLDSEVDLSLVVLREPDAAASEFTRAGIVPTYLGRGRFDLRTGFDLARIVRSEKIDILHCHGYGASNFGRLVGARQRIPVIVHEHFVDAAIPVYQRVVDRLLAPLTTRGLAVSKAVEDFLSGPRAVPKSRVEVLYNSVRQIESASGVEPDRESRSLRVGIIGRLDPVKGHTDFLDAAALVLRSRPDVEFRILGDGELRSALEAHTQELGIAAHVRFLGHRDDVHEVLSQLDLLVACSHSEGFSLAAAEAMSHGLAVIGTRVGGIPEVVEDGVTGLLVPAHAPTELAAAVEALLSDSELRQEMGSRGQARCRDLFSTEVTMSKLLCLYRELARPG